MGALTNTLILLDEPEISLHPSGARYLRDELIKISKSNTVVYSTHSIFMIDKRQIDRHLLVSKQKEQTQLQVANPEDSAFSEEEVVYGALQYSLFDNLKEKNLLFEGWKDKRAFELTHKDARLNKTAQKKLTQWGLCHIAGVKSCKNVVPIFQAANRDCTIISDDDPVAIQFKNDHEKHRLHGAWITYSSRLATAKVETMEDFYEQVYFEKHYKALSKSMHSNVSYADLTNVAFGRLAHIEGHLQKEGIAKEETKIFSNSLKQALIDDATSKSFSNVYFEFLEALASL